MLSHQQSDRLRFAVGSAFLRLFRSGIDTCALAEMSAAGAFEVAGMANRSEGEISNLIYEARMAEDSVAPPALVSTGG